MSHELRTRLTHFGYTQILKRLENLSDLESVSLDTIQQSGDIY